MDTSEVVQIATAIAKANGHSEPDSWAHQVLMHFIDGIEKVRDEVKTEAEAVVQHVEQAVEGVIDPHIAADQEVTNVQQ